jgi:predicted nucleic acid-binding protein
MLKVVLDVNILASATISQKGNPAKILTAWRQNKFELIIYVRIISPKEFVEILEKDN